MANSLQKLEWENTTRLLFFKHRGDLSKVLKDLKDKYESKVDNVDERITIDFVEKVIKKFKRQQKVNDPFVASHIMEYVFMGTKQREMLLDDDDQDLEDYKFYYRSACCDAVAREHINDKGEQHFICLKCEKICNAYRVPNLDIFEMKRKFRTERRSDEEQLVKAIDSLGFGGEKSPVVKQYFNQLSIGKSMKKVSSKEIKRLPPGDQQLIENMDNMDARDREAVRKQLEMIRRDEVGDGWPEENKSS